MHVSFIVASALLVTACAYNPAQPGPWNMPVVESHPELLSEEDLRAVLTIARRRLNSLFVFVRVDRVRVISHDDLTVYFPLAGAEVAGWFEFTRVDGQWRITKEVFRDPR